jgi:hypothetical protein
LSLSVHASNEETAKSHNKVYVEPTYVQTAQTAGEYKLVPYKERRGKWGATLSAGYSAYTPANLESSFVGAGIASPYETTQMPLIETQVVFKRNFPFASIGGELGLSYMATNSTSGPVDTTLDFKMLRVGATIAIDSLFSEPWLVPYGSAGVYTIYFDESLSGITFSGSTRVAPYLSGGVLIQLDWIDRTAARISYQETGTQSTFLYVEGRTLIASSAEQDPDYSSDVHWNTGIRVEF